MNCETISELLAAYLDNEVTLEERSWVESHLVSCTKCREELKLLESTQANLRRGLQASAEEGEPSPHAWAVVRQQIASDGSFWELSFGALLRGHALFFHLLQVLFRVFLEFGVAALATEIDPLPFVVRINFLADIAAQDRAGGLGRGCGQNRASQEQGQN